MCMYDMIRYRPCYEFIFINALPITLNVTHVRDIHVKYFVWFIYYVLCKFKSYE